MLKTFINYTKRSQTKVPSYAEAMPGLTITEAERDVHSCQTVATEGYLMCCTCAYQYQTGINTIFMKMIAPMDLWRPQSQLGKNKSFVLLKPQWWCKITLWSIIYLKALS